jgi:hypothetical protein
MLERILLDPKIKRCKSIEWETHIISFGEAAPKPRGGLYIYVSYAFVCVVAGGWRREPLWLLFSCNFLFCKSSIFFMFLIKFSILFLSMSS